MNFTAQSVWEMTKLFVRDPKDASERVIAAGLPVNVSVLMLVLAGVMSGVMAAVSVALYGTRTLTMQLPDGSEQVIEQASPLMTGAFSVLAGLGFAYFVYWVGTRSSGQGGLPQVLSVIATWQIAMTVLGVMAVLLDMLLPLAGFAMAVFVIVVSVRALVVGVQTVHEFEGAGRALMVILAALIVLFFVLMIVTAMFGPMLIQEVSNEL